MSYYDQCSIVSAGMISGWSHRIRYSYRFVSSLTAFFIICGVLTGCAGRRDQRILLEEAWSEDVLFSEDHTDYEGMSDTEQARDNAAGQTQAGNEEITDGAADVSGDTEEICVHVCGAVWNEGVYRLQAGSRIIDAVEAADGFRDDADRSYLNLACILQDGMKIQIPTRDEAEAAKEAAGAEENVQVRAVTVGSGDAEGIFIERDEESLHQAEAGSGHSSGTGKASSGRVNINTASSAELCTLPGVGEARARSIIEYREAHGGFSCIEDIMKVSGIKEKSFEQIKDRIDV